MIFSINLPEKLVKKIDRERGDVPRSRFILRLIEKVYTD
jgi:metal-responsive CopG/Arc/MetJ family transcriptional regulator